VFCIHGLGQTAVLFCVVGAAMHTKSDEAGFVLIMVNGYSNSWNAGTCCGAASTEQLDDVALYRAVFAEVGKHVNIDLDRVYATGLSNGGYMSFRLACEAADIFTAVAPNAAALGINEIGGGASRCPCCRCTARPIR
jgi:polyhydroxybutyrate depolymerase